MKKLSREGKGTNFDSEVERKKMSIKLNMDVRIHGKVLATS
jgi:hypothetical protein